MLKHLLGLLVLCIPASVMAAGPLVLEGPAGNTPATYENPNIIFNIESGPLGTIRDNDAADQLVLDALTLWNIIPTSIINLTQGADITVDIDENNFNSYIPDSVNSIIHNANDCLNPIVYDSDGSIIDAFFGIGASESVVGFAASTIFIGSSYFTEGFVVINGKPLYPPSTDIDNLLTSVIAHEIGHAFGLDHTQANINNNETLQSECPTTDKDSYPLMYPYACRITQNTHMDDEASISMLYPSADYYSTHGQLSGFFESGAIPVLGANIWVKEITTGAVYSVVSDYLKQGTGFFSLMLPEGTYELHANSINNEFFSGSSVGPYANDQTDISFQPPASSIGSVTFAAGGVPPALLTVTAGEATTVTFKTDGSGSFTTNNAILNLSPAHNTAAVCTVAETNDSGGGSPSPLLLFTFVIIPLLRFCARRLNVAVAT